MQYSRKATAAEREQTQKAPDETFKIMKFALYSLISILNGSRPHSATPCPVLTHSTLFYFFIFFTQNKGPEYYIAFIMKYLLQRFVKFLIADRMA